MSDVPLMNSLADDIPALTKKKHGCEKLKAKCLISMLTVILYSNQSHSSSLNLTNPTNVGNKY